MKSIIGAIAFFFMIENFAFGADPPKLFEGDILLPKYEMDNLDAFLNGTLYTGFTRNAITNPHGLWPGGVVPYSSSSLQQVSEEVRNVIIEGMKVYEKKTCIRFKPLENEVSYIEFIEGEGCYSHVGKSDWGGAQEVSIGSGCEYLATVLHELMHAVGFYHEQSRADRDEYVQIIDDNIEPGEKHNFKKHDLTMIKHLGEEYDYCSVMHYGEYYFGKVVDGVYLPTIVPLKETECNIGQAENFSPTDLRKINKLYECGGGQEITTTRGGGHDITTESTITTEPIIMTEPIITTEPIIITEPTVTTEPIETCQDHNESCPRWASIGECKKNPVYMKNYCRKSCGKCSTTTTSSKCVDKNAQCQTWASQGECYANPKYMHLNCAKSCNTCGTTNTNCKDLKATCGSWARFGYCSTYKSYMAKNCKKSCGYC